MSSKRLTNFSPNSEALLTDGARVLITGGEGFIGSQVRKLLEDYDVTVYFPSIDQCDLTTIEGVESAFSFDPDVVIHLAADVGGLGYLSQNSLEIFHNNMMMDLLVLRQSVAKGVKKFIGIGSVNSYPSVSEPPYSESHIWNGLPHESVLGYGIAKRMLAFNCKMHREIGSLNATTLILEGVFGPGDNFNTGQSRVIPANIVRCFDAINEGKERISVWGSGTPIRDFIFVEDAAKSILFTIDNIQTESLLNVGSGSPVSIRELVEMIAQIAGFKGTIEWDQSKPDGQKIRFLSCDAINNLGFRTQKPLFEALEETVNWYRSNFL